MRNQITSELRKLLTTRSAWGLLGGTMLVSGLAAWAMAANMVPTGHVTLTTLPGVQEAMALVPAFVLVLGIRSYTDEARHGSIVPTLLSSPVRRRVVAAKAVVTGTAAVGFALAAALTVVAVSGLILTIDGVSLEIGSVAEAGELLGRIALVSLLWSTLGLGVGLAVSHQVAAIVGSLVWLFAVENLVGALVPRVARFLPGQAGMSALGVVPDDALAPLVGAALLVGWTATFLVAGAGTFQRRDVA